MRAGWTDPATDVVTVVSGCVYLKRGWRRLRGRHPPPNLPASAAAAAAARRRLWLWQRRVVPSGTPPSQLPSLLHVYSISSLWTNLWPWWPDPCSGQPDPCTDGLNIVQRRGSVGAQPPHSDAPMDYTSRGQACSCVRIRGFRGGRRSSAACLLGQALRGVGANLPVVVAVLLPDWGWLLSLLFGAGLEWGT